MAEETTTGPIHLQVAPEEAGRPLAGIVAAALDAATAATVMARGGVWVDGVRVQDPAARVPTGAQITIHTPPGGRYSDVVFDPDWILFEDADLIAVDKPPAVYVEMTPWDTEGNLRVALERFLAQRDGATPRLHLAHRLDRDTSGVLLLSRNPAVNAALQAAFATGRVHKQYVCLCAGEPAEDAFEVVTGHGRSAHGLFRVYPPEYVGQLLLNGSRVKEMRTRFVVERRMGDSALLHAFPMTGRTHQIRLHLAYLGHPLIGDARYGGPAIWRGRHVPHQLLHAARLELPHPRTGQPVVITARPLAWADG